MDSATTQLILPQDIIHNAVDFKGRPAIRSKHGLWKSALLVLALEVTERVAFRGVSSNLINYVTGVLGQSTAVAAANFNAWIGVIYLLPMFGAVIADTFLGKYYTIIASSLFYFLGIGLLILTSVQPSLCCTNCEGSPGNGCSSQILTFYIALYLVAVACGGYRPCIQAFAADQFDGEHPEEGKARSSFFNWWFFGMTVGSLVGQTVMSYVQDNLSWTIGFGISCIVMVLGFVVFLLGSTTYRYITKDEGKSPFLKISGGFFTGVSNCCGSNSTSDASEGSWEIQHFDSTEQYKLLDEALAAPEFPKRDGNEVGCNSQVEESKGLCRLFPVWATSLVFGIVFAQQQTLFNKQGVTLDRSVGLSLTIPAASLQSFSSIVCLVFIPVYEWYLVPIARKLTGKPYGISSLRRIGTGFFISTLCMMTAAVVEARRLKTALDHGLIDLPGVTLPMSFWWLVPQYVLYGVAESLAMVGQVEFFYDQIPTGLRSVGLSVYLSIYGLGSLLSSFLVFLVDKLTREAGGNSWFSDNLNRAHLDYFYWLVAAMNAAALGIFICVAKSYVYKNVQR